MIVSFSLANFRSFASEETFSLVASNRLDNSHEGHAFPIPDSKERALRTAVLYGANGAGKSNLFKALYYLRAVALKGSRKNRGTGRKAFRFGALEDEPSTFDLQFIAEDKLYRFGVKVDDHRIIEEWLVHVVGGREKAIYERVTDNNGKVRVDAEGLRAGGEKLLALAKVGGPQNQSFLATVHVTLDEPDIGEQLSGVLTWFKGLSLIGPSASFSQLGTAMADEPALQEFAGDFLRSSSTGVDHLEVQRLEISEDEVRGLLPENLVSRILEDINGDRSAQVRLGDGEDINDDRRAHVRLGDGNELLVERNDKDEDRYYRITIKAAHRDNRGKIAPLDLTEESDGTRRLLHLIPALHRLQRRSAVCFIDELDRSLHPILALKFLEFFLKSCSAGKGQMIVTTHESNLLDLDLLRRDEIWFAEKDQDGATHLYSLMDFKVRKDLEIRKHYLEGRFGAVPFLGGLDRLLAENGQPE